MADVQLEHGFLRVANALEEATIYAPFTGVVQLKIVRLIIRLTFGWNQESVHLSMKDTADRCNVKYTGGFRRAFIDLVRENVITEIRPSIGRTPASFSLNKDFESWGKFSVPRAALRSFYGRRPVVVRDPDVQRPDVPSGASGEPKISSYVYYIQSGTRIKIGASGDPWRRVEELRTARPNCALVAVEPGDRRLELERHATFAADRMLPDREWFRLSDALGDHIGALRGTERSLSDEHQLDAFLTPRGASTSPVGATTKPGGASMVPGGGMVTGDNSQSGNGLEDRKDTRKTVEIQTTTATTVDGVDQSDFAIRLVSAMNAGIEKRWGEQINPLSFGQCDQLAADLIHESFTDLELARVAIGIACSTSRQPGPPAHPNYFRNVIREAHQRAQQREFDESNRRRSTSSPTPIADLVDPSAKAKRDELSKSFHVARRESAVAWGKDPANAVAYESIVALAKTKFDPEILASRFGPAALAEEILQLCETACGFPESIDAWLAVRAAS